MSKPHSALPDDFARVRKTLALGGSIVRSESLDALQRIEEQFEALREALEWCNSHRDSERFHSVAESALNRVASSPASVEETKAFGEFMVERERERSNPASTPEEDA